LKLPRDLSGRKLARALSRPGYSVTRQTGSHARLTTLEGGEHHVTVPRHGTLRTGTLSGIVREVADHFHISREEACQRLFGD
jgi:predicted RNA binding protein YcfA (HicA-like mRNA interferase family)